MIANARMYSINPATASAWRTLLEWVIARAQMPGNVIDYPAPQPLAPLWAREDLGGVFMCGFPLSRRTPRPIVLAAPVPDVSACHDEPVYWTDFIVRADAPFVRIEDTFGHRFAFTTPDSQSGYQAPRVFLARFAKPRGALFSEIVGPLFTPRRVVDAVLSGEADVGPLDSYVHALLRSTEPTLAAQLRTVAVSPPTPIPPLVASSGTAAAGVARLRQALGAVGNAEELAAVRHVLALRRFASIAVECYDDLQRAADRAGADGYPELA